MSGGDIGCRRHHDNFASNAGFAMAHGGMMFTNDDNGNMKQVSECLTVDCGQFILFMFTIYLHAIRCMHYTEQNTFFYIIKYREGL